MNLFFLSFRIELCAYSGYKIYPGRGRTLIRPDGRVRLLISVERRILILESIRFKILSWL